MFRIKAILITIGVVGILAITYFFFHHGQQNSPSAATDSGLQSQEQAGNSISSSDNTSFFSNLFSASQQHQQQNSLVQQNGQENASNSQPNQASNSQGAQSNSGSSQTSQPVVLKASPSFDTSKLTLTQSNDPTSLKNYAAQTADAVKNFDLINNGQDISTQFQTLDTNTLKSQQAMAQQNVAAIQKIPVPSDITGLTERYVLTYQNYANICDIVLQIKNPDLSDQDRTQKFNDLQQAFQQFSNNIANLSADIKQVSGQ